MSVTSAVGTARKPDHSPQLKRPIMPRSNMTTTYRAVEGTGSRTSRLAGTRAEPRLPQHDPQQTPTALAPARDNSVPRARLLQAAALLLEVIADGTPGDPDAAAVAPEHDPGLAEPDRVLVPALISVALGLHERHSGHSRAEAALVPEMADLPGTATGPAPPPGEPAWPGEPLTHSETRVLRYLPTHLGAPEIAAELCLSANTVKTHLQHLCRKLGAHSRHEVVQRARAIGLFTQSSHGPRTSGGQTAQLFGEERRCSAQS
jgi:LuxR family transcriptional regulator, maltose regulon positive regulatory protein